MRNHVRHNRSERTQPAPEEGHEREFALALLPGLPDDDDTDDSFEDDLDLVRVDCPECARPIAVFADEDRLPEHALCPTPWNPFGLTVCSGSGRPVEEARPLDGSLPGEVHDLDLGTLLVLPDTLDWRTQPFSHVGGPGSRPFRVPAPRAA
ncbi:hypothetical protein [Streptomyces sp. NPDC008317]|uniref:hypothetical protein n=1 Tax=Streptomyces sp. NPDC008317 TaxID=3364827 RepID=UPI0036EB1DBD